jgi:hypothetical protein
MLVVVQVKHNTPAMPHQLCNTLAGGQATCVQVWANLGCIESLWVHVALRGGESPVNVKGTPLPPAGHQPCFSDFIRPLPALELS